jgi:N-carbamoylputrescine amidase
MLCAVTGNRKGVPMKAIKPYKIGLIQMQMGEDVADNFARACTLLEKAAAQGVQIACLPELFRSQYFCQVESQEIFDLAEPIPGPSTEKLAAIAKKHRMVIVASLFEKRAPGICHNTAAVLDADGSLLGIYRKMHIPHDPLFYEKYYFSPGDTGFKTFDTAYGRIGVLVCWDQWFPEGARLTALQGAEVLFYPTAIGWHPGEKAQYGEAQADAWRTAQRAHAIANGVYVASVNRFGFEKPKGALGDGLEFWGRSFISDPYGRVLEEAQAPEESILIATVDPAAIEDTRRNWPFFRDRRIDAYGGLTQHPSS